jgi:hypothetical protein
MNDRVFLKCTNSVMPIDAVMDVLRTGGQWAINVAISEGCMLARVGTGAGDRLLRSGSPCIAGIFDASVSPNALREAIGHAGLGELREPKRHYPSWSRAVHAAYKRRWRAARKAAGMMAS